jgi:hypothetical protein
VLTKVGFFEGFLGEAKPSTAEYIDIFEERRQVSTTKSPKKTLLQVLPLLIFVEYPFIY